MCGRYVYYSSEEILRQFNYLNIEPNQVELTLGVPDNYNVSPGNEMPVIVRGSQEHKIEFMTWGLVPSWSKEPKSALKLINARQEGLTEKPMWKRLVKTRRCVVPARGFYEWKNIDGKKKPYYITPKNGSVFSFAGLWDVWSDGSGNDLYTFTIITTEPNDEMKAVHNRMPALLDKKYMDIWLEPGELPEELLHKVLGRPEDGSVNIVEVSADVNNAKNNFESLIYPIGEH